MKFSLNWLREMVDLKDIETKDIATKLILHTAEVEEVIAEKDFVQNVVAGKLLSFEKHADSDKLHIGQFDCGGHGKKQIVFGSVHPLETGKVYPVALAGAMLKSGIEIKDSEIRGTASEGMVCDNTELGMKNEGLLEFSEKEIGKNLADIYQGFRDELVDIDNKSLTHRPDLMGHWGIAREVASLYGKSFSHIPDFELGDPGSANTVDIEIDTENCRRVCAVRVENVHVEPSPIEDQLRLEALGVRAISNLVDVTNLTLLELGQPMHAFDADKINGTIRLRQAKVGETIVALDGKEYKLTEEDVVVADDKNVLSIAGIMGGEGFSVSEETKNIIFISESLDATTIRKTSQRLALRSDSSMRYEKSLDPEMCPHTIRRAVEHTKRFVPEAQVMSQLTDVYTRPFALQRVSLDPEILRKRSGINISNEDITQKLESLGFDVLPDGKDLDVKVPSWRSTKDVESAEDLIEEVVRLYGFEEIESELPTLPVNPPAVNKLRRQDWAIREHLSTQGLFEVYHSSFVAFDDPELTEADPKSYVSVQNPSSEAYTQLRQTLISNFVDELETEIRNHGEVDFFELGKTHSKKDGEVARLAIFSAKMNGKGAAQFYRVQNQLLQLIEELGIQKDRIDFVPGAKLFALAHPAQSAHITLDGQEIGIIASLHPQKHPVRKTAIAFVELETEKLLAAAEKSEQRYKNLSPFPAVRRDLSIVVPPKTLSGDLIKTAHEASELLTKCIFFDEFVDAEKLGELKNLSYHLEFRSWDKTLEEEEIDTAFANITKLLHEKFGAELRLEFDNRTQK